MNRRKICPPKETSNASGTGETMSSTEYEEPFIKRFGESFGEEALPNIENDYSRAKAYLMRQYLSSGDNLWDHLNEVLKKILVERPKDIAYNFEEFSYKVKEARYRDKSDFLLDVFVPPIHYPTSQKILQILQPSVEDNVLDKSENEEEEGKSEPNLLETFYYFELGGVGLPKEEILCISMHMKKLLTDFAVDKYRFWGKILGTQKNYYVAETELTEDELARINAEREEEEERLGLELKGKESLAREERQAKKEAEIEEAKEKERQLAAERSEILYQQMLKEAKLNQISIKPERKELEPWPPLPPLPVAIPKKNIIIPGEATGTGVNKKVFFVCNSPGDQWVQLPDVTPEQILAARKIKRAFTGDLESEVKTYPFFPGKEKNYLRAQIARISAGTQISPLGYYTFNEDEEEEEAEPEENKINYVKNPDYEPVAMRDLIDPSMAFWVHHTPYILGQGRTSWWNPNAKEEPNEDEGEAEEEDENQKEIGPELLTPLSEDSTLDAIVPWSVRKTSTLFPEQAIALVRSNLWPGAYAFATNKKFENIYIGYGYKFSATNHSPEPMKEIQEEYPRGPEIMEISDPTPEEEEEWENQHRLKQPSVEEEEDDEEGAATTNNDDDDADDEDDEE